MEVEREFQKMVFSVQWRICEAFGKRWAWKWVIIRYIPCVEAVLLSASKSRREEDGCPLRRYTIFQYDLWTSLLRTHPAKMIFWVGEPSVCVSCSRVTRSEKKDHLAQFPQTTVSFKNTYCICFNTSPGFYFLPKSRYLASKNDQHSNWTSVYLCNTVLAAGHMRARSAAWALLDVHICMQYCRLFRVSSCYYSLQLVKFPLLCPAAC